ncbi:hypothetical protein ACWCPS_03550 [Streptomyces mauvecolor]
MNTLVTEPRSVLPRVSGAAVTGAVLAYGACRFFSGVEQDSDRACSSTDGLCSTWWDWAVLPLTLTTSLIALIVIYKLLDLRPRLALIPPTVLLAPLPLVAAEATAGPWAAAITGAAWASSLALALWSRYRFLGLSASAAILIASLGVLYG